MAKAFDTDRCSGMRGTQGNNNDQPSHNGKEVMIDGVPVNDPSYRHDTVCVEQKKRRFQDESMDAGSLEELINQQRTRQLERTMRTLHTVGYLIGDVVEVASNDEGFVGSYYEATVVGQLTASNVYIVQYRNLMTDDFSAPLTENVPLEQIRPQTPQV
nr:DUF724 domain-containing protein 3 [Ipomoea batatas]